MTPRERCLATKRDGTPCRRYQVYPDGLCIQHHRQANPPTDAELAQRAEWKRLRDSWLADETPHERMTGQHEDCPYCAPDEACALHLPV